MDGTIILSFFLISLGALVIAIFVRRETKPTGDKFTVVLFTFSGDNTTTQNAANSFQKFIIRKLEREYGKEIVCLSRERKIKGENFKEQLAYAQKWAGRKAGCHLAVWADIEMDDDGQHYVGTVHYLKVSPLGSKLNDDSIGVFSDSGEFSDSFQIMPVGFAESVGKEQVQVAVDLIKLSWGLASYQKGDYDTAFRVLPNSFPNGEFLAGEAAHAKAIRTVESNQLFEDAETHYQKAIELNGYEERHETTNRLPHDRRDLVAARYYTHLGNTYFDEAISGRGQDPREKANKAISAFAEAAKIFEQFDNKQSYAYTLVREAEAWDELWVIDTDLTASADLNEAKGLLEKALPIVKHDSSAYALAQKELGRIYTVERQYEKAIEAEKYALRLFTDDADTIGMSGSLVYLGRAQTANGTFLKNEQKFEEGIVSFHQSCELFKSELTHNCATAHQGAGDALVLWAVKSWRRNSAPWSASLDRALDEYHHAEAFLSPKQQADSYTELKLREARVYTEKAIGEAEKQGQPLIPLQAQVDDLSKGIDALTQVKSKADRLKQELALRYQRMAAYSNDPEVKRKYLELAKTLR